MAKTTKRRTKKQSGLLKRFDLSNKRVQFFTVIALVAILGGGFFLVRSFAASALTWSAAEFNAPARTTLPRDDGKPGERYISFTSANQYYNVKSSKSVPAAGSYKVCVRAKASAPGKKLRVSVIKGFGNIENRDINVAQTGAFTHVCHTQPVNLSASNRQVQVGVQPVSGHLNLYVTAVSLETSATSSDPPK